MVLELFAVNSNSKLEVDSCGIRTIFSKSECLFTCRALFIHT